MIFLKLFASITNWSIDSFDYLFWKLLVKMIFDRKHDGNQQKLVSAILFLILLKTIHYTFIKYIYLKSNFQKSFFEKQQQQQNNSKKQTCRKTTFFKSAFLRVLTWEFEIIIAQNVTQWRLLFVNVKQYCPILTVISHYH